MYEYYQIKRSFAGISCLIPADLRHVTMDTEQAFFGDVVTFFCRPGYSFPDNALVHTTECLDDGGWSSDFVDCQGQFLDE